MKKQSEFGKIKGVDLLNALYYFIGTLGAMVLTYLEAFKAFPSMTELIGMAGTSAIPPFLSIFKRLFKNSDGELLKKENTVMGNDDTDPDTGGATFPPRK